MIAQPTTNLKTIIAPGVIGNALEWYDFSLYGYFAPIIAHLFFPQADKAIAIMTTFGVFAMGFLMRPLGAILFGHFGDRWGRKKVLATAVIIMAIATALIGMLPTYNQIGVYAGLLLTACRLLQGLAIGGEFAGSIVYIVEHAPSQRRGFFGSWAMMSTTFGLLLGSGVAAIAEHFAAVTWSWRIPFLLGILLGIVGLYLRLRMPETPSFNEIAQHNKIIKRPLLTALGQAPLALLKTFFIDFLPAIGFYLIFIYLSTYLNLYFKVPLSTTLTINTISLLVIVFTVPLVGHWSDLWGRKKVMLLGAIAFAVLSYPLFILLAKATFLAILTVQVIFALMMAFCCAALPALMAEFYPTKIRYTGVALPYNLANALLGGTAPLVVTILMHKTNNLLAPSFYLIFAAIILILTLLVTRETYTEMLR